MNSHQIASQFYYRANHQAYTYVMFCCKTITVQPPCATTSRKRPPIQNNQSQSLTVGASSKRPPPVSDRDHFLGPTVNDFLLFLTSGNRPLDACSLCALCYLIENTKNSSNNMKLHMS